mgnify:CR=1 FL=1
MMSLVINIIIILMHYSVSSFSLISFGILKIYEEVFFSGDGCTEHPTSKQFPGKRELRLMIFISNKKIHTKTPFYVLQIYVDELILSRLNFCLFWRDYVLLWESDIHGWTRERERGNKLSRQNAAFVNLCLEINLISWFIDHNLST